ncbi:MAG: hypothetical protein V4700_01075 [Pseudomonadota bacterium]
MRNVTIEGDKIKIICSNKKNSGKERKIPNHCDRELLQEAANFYSELKNNEVDIAPLLKYCSTKFRCTDSSYIIEAIIHFILLEIVIFVYAAVASKIFSPTKIFCSFLGATFTAYVLTIGKSDWGAYNRKHLEINNRRNKLEQYMREYKKVTSSKMLLFSPTADTADITDGAPRNNGHEIIMQASCAT